MVKIHYVEIDHPRYKYELTERYEHPEAIAIRPASDVVIGYTGKPGELRLTTAGRLSVDANYAWDGPSGPTIDTPDFMRGSLVHDSLYQMLREERIGSYRTDRSTWEKNRKLADQLLRDLCLEDGMNALRASWVYAGVRLFSGPSARGKRA